MSIRDDIVFSISCSHMEMLSHKRKYPLVPQDVLESLQNMIITSDMDIYLIKLKTHLLRMDQWIMVFDISREVFDELSVRDCVSLNLSS